MKPIIRVENVSKRYKLGQRRANYGTLRDAIAGTVRSSLAPRRNGKETAATLWALQDVSFEVAPGEVVGVIGSNGAGKSTLLKLLSRITEPTAGRIQLYGRMGSLLEVGTGFHPELSGRENIYLNGAVLGMKRAEITRKFDDIVAFAEVERFVDTPVKRYSSGMYLRLAFAVAAHLEPEILLVDEVLAVGDGNFQKKCMGKIGEVAEQGRTILFVSHNMSAITRLCPRTILLDHGRIQSDGPSPAVASEYLGKFLQKNATREWTETDAPGDRVARLRAVRIKTEDGQITDVIDIRKPVAIEMEFDVLTEGHVLVPNYHFLNESGTYIFVAGDTDSPWRDRPRPAGRYVSTAWIPGNLLAESTIMVGAALTTPEPEVIHFFVRETVGFQVIDMMEGDSARGGYVGHIPGLVRPLLKWDTVYTPLSESVANKALPQKYRRN